MTEGPRFSNGSSVSLESPNVILHLQLMLSMILFSFDMSELSDTNDYH